MKFKLIGFKPKMVSNRVPDGIKVLFSEILGLDVIKVYVEGEFIIVQLEKEGKLMYPMSEVQELIYEPKEGDKK